MAAEEQRSADEIADDFARAVDQHDVEKVLSLCSPDVELMWLPVGTFHGVDEVRQQLQELYTAFPDFSRPTDRRHVAGDSVVLEYHATGTFEGGPFAGLEPTGKRGRVLVCEVIEVSNGKVVRAASYWDGMQMARELGIMPAEGSVGDRAMSTVINFASRAKKTLRR